MTNKVLLTEKQFDITLSRLCHQLIENHHDFANTVLVGIQPRGVFLSRRLQTLLNQMLKKPVTVGELDITFYRDDFGRREMIEPSSNQMNFLVEDKKVILVDDVLYTGRTIRAALDALVDFGRPSKVELLVLVNRRYSRHLPIEPDYIGLDVDTLSSEKVLVNWREESAKDEVCLSSRLNNG